MDAKKTVLGIGVLIVLILLSFLSFGGGKEEGGQTPPSPPAAGSLEEAYEKFRVVEGDWSGSWTNNTFGSTGSATGEISLKEDGTASFTIDLGGMVFGMIDPPSKTFAGTFDENGADFSAAGDDLFGDLTISIDAQGKINISGLNLPFTNIALLSAEGTITSSEVNINYTVGFTDNTSASGVLKMTR